MPFLNIKAAQRLLFGGFQKRKPGQVFGQVGCQMTRKEMLDIIAISGLILKIFERLSWMPRSDWNRMVLSRIHVSGMNLKPIIMNRHVRCLHFDEKTSILAAASDHTGRTRLFFPDASFKDFEMPRSVTNVTVLTRELIAVCSLENHALLMRRTGDNFQRIGFFQHRDLKEKDSVDVCCCDPNTGFVATADTTGHINIWRIDEITSQPILLCELKGHQTKVKRMNFQPNLNMLLSIGSSGEAIIWVLTEDGTSVLSSTVLTWKGKRATSFAFVPKTNKIVFGFNRPEIQFWSCEVTPDNHVVTKFLFQKEFDDSQIGWISSISFYPDFPAILIGTGTLEDGKRVPAYLLYWGTTSSGEIFVKVHQRLGRFFRYSILTWAYGLPVIGN